MRLAQRSISSASWNIISNLSKSAVLLARSILLARLLPVEVFGIYGYAASIIVLTVTFANFGMQGAFLHRSPHTTNEDNAAATHFTLKLILTLYWALFIILGAWIFTFGQLRIALFTLTIATAGNQLTQTPKLILLRRVVHRRLAILNFVNALMTTIVAVGLAWNGFTLLALIATDYVTLALNIFSMYIWKPVWKPHLLWSITSIRYFLRFGSRNLLAESLQRATERVDDLWTGYFLGKIPLGYYSRAYTFATYPRMVVASPINAVTAGMYAELKGNRKRLSKAFFQVNAFLIRLNFLFAGLLTLIAPEFIRLLLGVKWMPMLTAFRLMLLFTLIDPIKLTVGYLFVTQGSPGILIRTRTVQFIVLLAGLFILGNIWNINGVALAVDLMLGIGIVILFHKAREFVDFSIMKIFSAPTIALFAGLIGTIIVINASAIQNSDWLTGTLKIISFSIIYIGILLLLDYKSLVEMHIWFKKRVKVK